MKLEALHIGMKVRHPQYGSGVVKTIGPLAAEILFNEGLRSVAPEPSGLVVDEPWAEVAGLGVPLSQFIIETAEAAVKALGLERPDSVSGELGHRWKGGTLLLQPGDAGTASKEVPIETFFHKIIMMRNQLRVLEQKLNGHPVLTEGEKMDLQEYITRCYGSMTTFNVFFREKESHF